MTNTFLQPSCWVIILSFMSKVIAFLLLFSPQARDTADRLFSCLCPLFIPVMEQMTVSCQLQLTAVAQKHASYTTRCYPRKDQNSKFHVLGLLNAYYSCIIINFKNHNWSIIIYGEAVCNQMSVSTSTRWHSLIFAFTSASTVFRNLHLQNI